MAMSGNLPDLANITALALSAAGFGFLCLAAAIDVRRFIIPNWLNICLLILAVAYGLVVVDFNWLIHLACGALFFFLGALMFQFRMLGGGDVKLMAVLAFWAGPAYAVGFLFFTALGGGLVSVIYLALAAVKKKRLKAADPATEFNIMRQPVPYGLAIAVGGVYVFLSILEHLGYSVRM
jgi:prepilin peptidase CpaA